MQIQAIVIFMFQIVSSLTMTYKDELTKIPKYVVYGFPLDSAHNSLSWRKQIWRILDSSHIVARFLDAACC